MLSSDTFRAGDDKSRSKAFLFNLATQLFQGRYDCVNVELVDIYVKYPLMAMLLENNPRKFTG